MMDQEKVNILLVDDQPAKLLAYEVILKELGENLVKASSGREALEFLLKNDVAVILVDVCMPELDGFELLQALRGDPRGARMPIILLSARAGEEARVEGLQAGADDYLVKPFSARELMARVGGALELARVRRNGTKLSVALFAVLGADGARSADDDIMRKLGDTLSLSTRMTDITVRWSPDTLLAVLPEAELDDAAVFVERVRTSARVLELGRAAAVTLCVGTAEYDASETGLDAAVARAGQALRAPEQP